MTDFDRDLRDRLRTVQLPPAPDTLHRALDDVVRIPVPARRSSRRPLVLFGLAAALMATGLLVAGSALQRRDDASPAPPSFAAIVQATAAPTTSPTPTPVFPSEVDGLHVYTVSELQTERAAGRVSGGPIALAGYWSYLGLMHTCVLPDHTPGELELYCSDGEYGITERDEPAMVLLNPGGRVRPASGPMLTPWVPNEVWVAQLVNLRPVNGQPFPPVPIVAIGHLDDPRAADCRPQARQLCEDRFVMDEIVQFDPAAVPTPGITPSPSPFPFDSPPPLALDMNICRAGAKTSDFSFVGWMAGSELAPQLTSGVTFDNQTLAVAITRDVELRSGQDKQGRHYRLMGRRVCIAREWETGSVGLDTIKGSRYRLYDDGTVVPIADPSR